MRRAVVLSEPERDTRRYLERQLRDDGFEVAGAGHSTETLELVERAQPDLVLAAGSDLCRRLREGEPGRSWNRSVPIIVVAPVHADPVDRVRAFERGADDVVGRPIVYAELLARIQALLRRSRPEEGDVVEAGGIVIDRRTRRVRVGCRTVTLAGREFELLVALAREPRRVSTKEDLLRDVWGFRSRVRTRTLDSHASRVRRKLAAVSDEHYVVNTWGVGYRLLE